jgi:hypothetical protein
VNEVVLKQVLEQPGDLGRRLIALEDLDGDLHARQAAVGPAERVQQLVEVRVA